MEAKNELITCIYCKQTRPPSREHILASSLGGDATAPIDCVDCNSRIFSPLDQALSDRSLVALARAAYTPSSAFDVKVVGEHFYEDRDRGLFVEVAITNEFRATPLPQLHMRIGTTEASMVASSKDDVERIVTYIDGRIAKGNLRKLHVKYGPVERCTTARIVMHRTKDAYLRVAETGHEERVFEWLEKNWAELRAVLLGQEYNAESVASPTIELHMATRLDDVFRAVAKTAFNVLAHDLGVDFALQREFDDLRNYVLGRDIRHPKERAEGAPAVDGRFVRSIEDPPLVPTDKHAVTLAYHDGKMHAFVTFYGELSFFVTLGAIHLNEAVLQTREFSTVRSGNRLLGVEEVYDRLQARAAGRK